MRFSYGLQDESYKHIHGDRVYNAMGKIFENTHISLAAAKGDWAAFQVLVMGDDDFTLSVDKNPLFSPLGNLDNIRLESSVEEGFEDLCLSMNIIGLVEDDDRLLKSDILLHDGAVHVKRNEVQPVWVEIKVPQNASPGSYKGQIRLLKHSMFSDEELLVILTFELEVKDVTMPTPNEYVFHLDLWQHLSNIARKHEVVLWSDRHFEVVEGYVKSLADLGQKAVTVIASEIPWSGQRCFDTVNYPSDLFEYSMIRVEKGIDGSFRYDFSPMERYIELCFKHGIDKEIEVFGLVNIWVSPEKGYGGVAPSYPDAIRIRYYDHSDGCYKYMKSDLEIKDYIKALEQYFIDKGWIDKVLVVADEPADVDLYRVRLNLLKELAPSFKYKTAINHVEFIDEFKDEIQDFVPVLPCICEEWDLLNKMKDKIEGRLLWYVCCWPPIPNTFISSPLLESRLIGLLTSYMELDGFLRWNYTVWPERPRERMSYKYPGWKAGDTNFVYPANDGRPLLTLRYKNLKRGIEDFELIERLRALHPNAETLLEEVWDKILRNKNIKDFHVELGKKPEELYSLDYKDYSDAKVLLLSELEKLENK